MSVITANTGSNNWNTNGAWVGGVQPTAADDVVIPASAVVTIPAATTVLGRSLTVAASGTLAWAATTSILTLGDATAGLANVALSIAATSTITLTGVGTINLVSTSATQQTIDSGGKTLPNITQNGVGSSYLLSAALTSSGNVTLSAGTLNTNSQSCSWVSFVSTVNNTRVVTLGTSLITLRGAGISAWNMASAGTITFTANTAVVTLTGTGSTFSTPNYSGYNGLSLVMAGAGTSLIGAGSITLANLTITGTAAKTGIVNISSPVITLTGAFTVNGNSVINRVLVSSATRGTAVTISATTLGTSSNVDFMDITAAGASAPWDLSAITGGSGDAQGNSSITFTTPITQNYSSGTGTWSTMAWSSRVPLPQDNVAISGTGTITYDMPRLGKDINFTGFTGAYTGGINWEVYGSYTLASGMTYGPIASGGFAGRGTHTITTNGMSLGATTTTFNGPGGTYTLQDAFTTAGAIQLISATLDTNNFNVTSLIFSSGVTTTRSLILGTTTWTLLQTTATNVWNAFATGLTMSAGSSTIVIGTASANTRTFAGAGFTYGTLTYTVAGSTGQLTITGANTFTGISFQPSGTARTIVFPNATTTTVTSAAGWQVFGTAGQLATVTSASAGSAFTLAIPSGVVSSDYISLKDSTASGATPFYAGANSTNVSGNTGWLFTAAPSSNGNFLMFM